MFRVGFRVFRVGFRVFRAVFRVGFRVFRAGFRVFRVGFRVFRVGSGWGSGFYRHPVFLAISGIWLTTCCLFVVFQVSYRYDLGLRNVCEIQFEIHHHVVYHFVTFSPLTAILILNIRILIVAEKQRKRILAETALPVTTSNGQAGNKMSATHGFFRAHKAVKTFSIVVTVLGFCVLIPNVVGPVLYYYCSDSCKQMWFVVFH